MVLPCNEPAALSRWERLSELSCLSHAATSASWIHVWCCTSATFMLPWGQTSYGGQEETLCLSTTTSLAWSSTLRPPFSNSSKNITLYQVKDVVFLSSSSSSTTTWLMYFHLWELLRADWRCICIYTCVSCGRNVSPIAFGRGLADFESISSSTAMWFQILCDWTNEWHEIATCQKAKYSDLNSSHLPGHEFVTGTRSGEQLHSFSSDEDYALQDKAPESFYHISFTSSQKCWSCTTAASRHVLGWRREKVHTV